MTIDTLCESTKLRLIAAADRLLACTKTAACIIPIQGRYQIIAIGTKPDVARLLELGPAARLASQPQAERGAWIDRLSTYDPDFDNGRMQCRDQFRDGDYIKVEDVREALAAPMGREAQAEPKCPICKDTGRYADEYITTEAGHEPILHDCDCGGVPATVAQGEQADEVRNRSLDEAERVVEAALAEARNAALEEAAAHITRGNEQVRDNGWVDCANERARCANAIRSLKRAGDTGEQADGGAR